MPSYQPAMPLVFDLALSLSGEIPSSTWPLAPLAPAPLAPRRSPRRHSSPRRQAAAARSLVAARSTRVIPSSAAARRGAQRGQRTSRRTPQLRQHSEPRRFYEQPWPFDTGSRTAVALANLALPKRPTKKRGT